MQSFPEFSNFTWLVHDDQGLAIIVFRKQSSSLSAQSRVVFFFKLLFPEQLPSAASDTSSEQPAVIYRFDLGEPKQLVVKPHRQRSTFVDHHALPARGPKPHALDFKSAVLAL